MGSLATSPLQTCPHFLRTLQQTAFLNRTSKLWSSRAFNPKMEGLGARRGIVTAWSENLHEVFDETARPNKYKGLSPPPAHGCKEQIQGPVPTNKHEQIQGPVPTDKYWRDAPRIVQLPRNHQCSVARAPSHLPVWRMGSWRKETIPSSSPCRAMAPCLQPTMQGEGALSTTNRAGRGCASRSHEPHRQEKVSLKRVKRLSRIS